MGCAAFKAGDLSVGDVEPGETELTEEWGKSVAGNFDSFRYGVAYFPCHSDQDRYRTPVPLTNLRGGLDRGDQNKGVQGEDDNDEKFFAFGLFDGHGKSAVVADLCRESLLDEVVRGDATDAAAVVEEAKCKGASADEGTMTADQIKARVLSTLQIQIDDKERIQQGRALSEGPASPLPSDEAIVDAFRTVHQRVAHQYPGTRGGATATTLFLGANSTDAKTWDLKCGWAGDSGCMLIQPDGTTCEPLSIDHSVQNLAERARIDALARTDIAEGRKPTSYIARRRNHHGQIGPEALFGGPDSAHTSHLMTRSIGDHHGSPAMIPDAEVVSRENVASGTRMVMASDGLWDVAKEEQVIYAYLTPAKPLLGLLSVFLNLIFKFKATQLNLLEHFELHNPDRSCRPK
mmetsp:Transcript_75270/g.214086  ORF Transcript_75270/g.214086 Transcript_75270/m.214086 type:complete len:404 (+) Transcript_75270:391-1602(+)